MWTIKIDYSTGDSFGSHDAEDFVGYSWDNLDNAKKSLLFIKKHYEYYRDKTRRFGNKKLVPKPENYKDDYSVAIINNSGKIEYISAFWCGYFESLQSAEIVVDKDESMMIEF